MTLTTPPRYSVIIPFRNEADAARTVINDVCSVLTRLGPAFEVVAIDDGSTDRTRDELNAVAAAWPQTRVLQQPRSLGQSAALWRGFAAAHGEILISLDGDGQNVPSDIPRLLEQLAHADMVVGLRRPRRDSWLRRAMSRVANLVRARVLGDQLTDGGCALRVWRREVTAAFRPIRTLHSFMPALAVAAGFRVIEIPVEHRARLGGRSNYGLRAMLWRPCYDMIALWWHLRRQRS